MKIEDSARKHFFWCFSFLLLYLASGSTGLYGTSSIISFLTEDIKLINIFYHIYYE